VTYPLVTLSTRAQVDAKGEHHSITAALKKILENEGVPGLYSGLKSALFGIGITNGINPCDT
jgi:adenine nucleotide transporter 17